MKCPCYLKTCELWSTRIPTEKMLDRMLLELIALSTGRWPRHGMMMRRDCYPNRSNFGSIDENRQGDQLQQHMQTQR